MSDGLANTAGADREGVPDGAAGGCGPPDGKLRARYKIGIDANRPVHPKTGEIQPQVADPDVIASTGAGWVRLNFILRPWDHPLDKTLHDGRSWQQTYRRLVSGFRDRGIQVYGLIGCEAMPTIPKDQFRTGAAHGDVVYGWIEEYAAQFLAIVKMFKGDVQVFESFNEPDDWHGQNRNWIHPTWFAIMLQRIYDAVHADPELNDIRLVSGPLQGLQSNHNGPVHYLRATYQAGKQWFDWGHEGAPFPFDGVGYHIYVKPGYTPLRAEQAEAVRNTCRRYLDAMHQLIREEEGNDKPLFVSELGWTSNIDRRVILRREEFQAQSLEAGLGTLLDDPFVELGFCFCTQDFRIESRDENYGLYRMGELQPWNRKPAFYTFKALCEREVDPLPVEGAAGPVPGADDEMEELVDATESEGEITNQQIITAFYHAAADLRLRNRWALLSKAGLDLRELAADRRGAYNGPPLEQLPTLERRELNAVQARLGAKPTGSGSPPLSLARFPSPARTGGSATDVLDSDLSLDLAVALQEQVTAELKEVRGLLERILERFPVPDGSTAPPREQA